MGQPALSVTFNSQGYFKIEKKCFRRTSRIVVQVVLYLDLNWLAICFKQCVDQTIGAFVKSLSNLF